MRCSSNRVGIRSVILQIDTRLRVPIRKYGCYYMSLLFLVNKYTNTALSVTRINNSIYMGAIQQGHMGQNCYMTDPTGFCKWLGWDARYTGSHVPVSYVCQQNEAEILRFQHPKFGSHFVVGDGNGWVAYDPYGESLSVAEGVLKDKRIFRF